MLTRADEVYRGYGIVFLGERRGQLEAAVFPKILSSGEVVGAALFKTASATSVEGREVLFGRAHEIVDAHLEQSAP